jgi:hypothetical protein
MYQRTNGKHTRVVDRLHATLLHVRQEAIECTLVQLEVSLHASLEAKSLSSELCSVQLVLLLLESELLKRLHLALLIRSQLVMLLFV